MSDLKRVRGTHDILPDGMRRHRRVVDRARAIARRYGYEEIAPPILEFTEVFKRTLGETSDIVTKEMYTFVDLSGDTVTLRPEFTAGIARAFVSNGLAQKLPLKYFCSGPVFRYERPQKGRHRQFHQINVELLGVADPLGDVEVIALANDVLTSLKLKARPVLEINSLGDKESRAGYRRALTGYLQNYTSDLSPDSRLRLQRNPLRILDSKDLGDIKIVADAPTLDKHLNRPSRDHFDKVMAGLDKLGIPFVRNHYLVRGLDYYCHTAFEFKAPTKLGAQDAVLAGGRYDGLIETMGGPPTPATGWAAGVERLVMLAKTRPVAVKPIAVVAAGDDAQLEAFALAQRLRAAGFTVDVGFSGKLKKRLERANKAGAVAAVILGPDELAKKAATVRDMETGEQAAVPMASLESHLARYR